MKFNTVAVYHGMYSRTLLNTAVYHGTLFLAVPSPTIFALQSFKSTGLSVQKKRKMDFQDGCHVLDFRSKPF